MVLPPCGWKLFSGSVTSLPAKRNMVGSFCSAFGCSNRKGGSVQLHFYRFPNPKTHVDNRERSKRWVINCKRQDLMTETAEYLHENCRLCDVHFADNQFMNKDRKQDGLLWNAVPTVFPQFATSTIKERKPPKGRCLDNGVELNRFEVDPSLVVSRHHSYAKASNSETKSTDKLVSEEFQVDCMVDTIVDLQKKLVTAEKEKHHKDNPQQQLTVDDVVEGAKALGLKSSAAEFLRGQLKNCSRPIKGHRWSEQDKGLALGIYFRSRAAYKVFSSVFTMPSETTLNRFVRSIPTQVGISQDLVSLLKVKAKVLDQQSKFCIVTFDEMSMRQEISYSATKDEVTGVVHLQDKTSTPANQALVFMARAIAANWKQPLSFYFSQNAASASDLDVLLKENLSALLEAGLKPVAIVCDQGSCNRSLYTKLGITAEKPYFEHKNQKIFAQHDMPHVLKNIRNTLKKYDISHGDTKCFI